MTGPRIGTVVLAAGAAERMGCPKQLLEVGGRSLVRRAAEAVLELGVGRVVVVLGAHADRVAPELAGLRVTVASHDGWREGMGSSLRAGVEALATEAELAGILVTLADQPCVDAGVLGRVVSAFREGGADAVASGYADAVGVPALFGPSWFARLRALEGEQGAGRLLRAAPDAVRVVPVPEAALDVDTPDDLARARAMVADREAGR